MELNIELLQKIIDDSEITSRDIIAEKYELSDRVAGYYWFVAKNIGVISEMFNTDDELVEQNVKYKKQQQKFQDYNRIERKSFREYARVENAVAEYVEKLVEVFVSNPYKTEGLSHTASDKAVGVIHISDVHFNELIDINSNKYDFSVASKRFYKLVHEATRYFIVQGVTDVFVLLTGDLMNSDRRLDELVSMATNRSKATFIAVQILENAIMHLNQKFNVHVAGVVGNESRVGKDYNWSNDMVSDNYDFVIFNILRYKLKDVNGVSFLGLSNKHEEVVEVNGKNFLLVHGHQIGKDISKDVSKLIRKYAQMDIDIDFVIWGHLHEAMIADLYARSSSVCGSNNYSEDALLLVSRASQNIHVVFSKDRIDSVKVDLQNTDGYAGYNTQDWTDAYNPKSLDKVRKHETILRIIV